jgi:hypothetical protein
VGSFIVALIHNQYFTVDHRSVLVLTSDSLVMDALIQGMLDGVESALNTLVDSITSYNPSVAAATNLLAADDEFNKGGTQCTKLDLAAKMLHVLIPTTVVIHQSNNARIHHLRKTIDALNQSITSNVTLLADVRKDILATPATIFPKSQRSVPYHELLDYANRISRYTVPPTLRLSASNSQGPSRAPSQHPVASAENGVFVEQHVLPTTTGSPNNIQSQGEGFGVASLEPSEVQWLDPLTQIPFVPWPSEDVIRQGALAQVQLILEQGLDPSKVDISEDDSVKHEASEDIMMVDSHGDSTLEHNLCSSRPLANGLFQPKEEKPKVFGGLDLYDPETDA